MVVARREVEGMLVSAIAYGVALGQSLPEAWGDAEATLQFVAGKLPEELQGLLHREDQGPVEAYLEGLVASQF